MRNQNQQPTETPDQGNLPRRDRSHVEDTPAKDRDLRNDRTIDDPRVDLEERRAPGAENAEDELDDEDDEGPEEIR